ncbi:MMPL family transporter [Streptomyces sp. UNOC14_S4]|uniref:MMPL family transporter n=1 Tax=Streptomyces sp. UNOC14_S4 TaxID=2872340 RepID=UPI001E376CEF|nr:MMPL family transporter [Streptomyces sp. UNOC14_S4]
MGIAYVTTQAISCLLAKGFGLTVGGGRVVIPLVLGVVFVILVLLLRALVAPVLLMATTVLSFFAALGISWVLFQHVMGFPAVDIQVMLIGFLFLVALGVDYNIFLIHRIREEVGVLGHKAGVLSGLTSTGGVITSAGAVLTATFAALTSAPRVAFVEIGVVVAIGVLIDTFLVRSVLVPALSLVPRRGPRLLVAEPPGGAFGLAVPVRTPEWHRTGLPRIGRRPAARVAESAAGTINSMPQEAPDNAAPLDENGAPLYGSSGRINAFSGSGQRAAGSGQRAAGSGQRAAGCAARCPVGGGVASAARRAARLRRGRAHSRPVHAGAGLRVRRGCLRRPGACRGSYRQLGAGV